VSATHVRRARGRDAAVLAALCVEHAAFERARIEGEGLPARLAAALDTEAGGLAAWVVERDGAVIGYASAMPAFSTWAARAYVHLDGLFVRADARGAGLGRALFDAVRAHALALGCLELQWQTPAWNADAARFYRRLGAHESEKRRYHLAVRD
jgi:GNAT superfamily N-acetyltransferase